MRKQFLMLLLVMQADLEDAGHLGPFRILHDRKQPLDRFIDVGTEGRNILAIRPGGQAPFRSAWRGPAAT